jgi:hypothetical protein
MKTQVAFPGARGVDSLPYSKGGTCAQAQALAKSGIEFFIGYLGAMNPERLGYILGAGLAFMPVTFAGEYKDGAADEIAQLKALGIPRGATVWLDLEGLDAWNTPANDLIRLINTWAYDIKSGGWMPGLYVGSPQPLSGEQLWKLGVLRYWLGIGRSVGKQPGATRALTGLPDGTIDAYPKCGWCMRQDWHDNPVPGRAGGMLWKDTGVFVDTNAIQADHQGRLPTWVVAG